jgi:hypothetical protein
VHEFRQGAHACTFNAGKEDLVSFFHVFYGSPKEGL